MLYKDLHYLYFYLMTGRIASHAEVTCLERRLRGCHEEIQDVDDSISEKWASLANLAATHVRRERLRLRRSALGEYMFKGCQLEELRRAFKGWYDIWQWNRNSKGAFRINEGLTKQRLDLRRLEREARDAAIRRNKGRLDPG